MYRLRTTGRHRVQTLTSVKRVLFVVALATLLLVWALGARADGPRKGLAGPGGCDVPGMSQILQDQHADWFYTWRACLHCDDYWGTGAYVPMLGGTRGGQQEKNRRWLVKQIIKRRDYTGGYWLIGNEPDNCHEDGLDPGEAVDRYGRTADIIHEVDPSAKLVVLGLMRPSVDWLHRWNETWSESRNDTPRDQFAGYHIHLYTNISPDWEARLAAWLGATKGFECWVTEYGSLPTLDCETMRQMTNYLSSVGGVTRYAVFYTGLPNGEWLGTSLYTWQDGTPVLTELGRCYADLPDTTPTAPATQTQAPSLTWTLTSTQTLTPTLTQTPTWTPTQTPTLRPIRTPTPRPTRTRTPQPTLTPTAVLTATPGPTPTRQHASSAKYIIYVPFYQPAN